MSTWKIKRKRTEAKAAEQSEIVRPSGYPVVDSEVEWVSQREHLASKPHKVIPGGYESLAGDVNAMLRHIGIEKADLVRKSAMGEFTRLNDFCTKSGNMLHYMVCRQVVPKPNFDPTYLFFKIGEKVLRFSRDEYVLVSGLKFGPSSFDPYAAHELLENSIYKRLFRAKEKITTCDVHAVYIKIFCMCSLKSDSLWALAAAWNSSITAWVSPQFSLNVVCAKAVRRTKNMVGKVRGYVRNEM